MSRSNVHSHPIFARFYARLSRAEEKYGVHDYRRELLAGLTSLNHSSCTSTQIES